jgi:Tfp pilus assembly protein PilW
VRCRPGPLGFSLIELVIVTLLGSLVIMATFNVLVSNQRTMTAVAAKIRGQRTLRSGASIVAGELREISPATGDLIEMGDDSADQSSVAFNMTERGVVEVLTNWDAARYSALPAWGSADTTGALPDGTWSATVTKMTDFFYYIDVTGVVSRGGPLRAGASHEIGVIAHVTSASLAHRRP